MREVPQQQQDSEPNPPRRPLGHPVEFNSMDIDTTIIGPPNEDFAPALRSEHIQRLNRPSLSYWQDAWIRLKKNKQALASLGIVAFLLLFVTLGPAVWRTDPSAQNMQRISEGPSIGQKAIVLPELPSYQEIVLNDVPAAPTGVDAATLGAPAQVQLLVPPTTQAVRLKWDPVPGAASYVVYRGSAKPEGTSNLGVPLIEVDAGNKVSYEDSFNLTPGTNYYSIVAKNGDESPKFTSLKVELAPAIALEEALKFKADAKIGDQVTLQSHPLGTDYLGRDMLARLIQGGRVSLFIGLFSPLFATLIGVAIGGIAGYSGGKTDTWLMRITDFTLALPFLLCIILIKVAFGIQAGESGVMPMLIAMVALSWSGTARLTRGQVLQLRETEFVQASRLLGAKPLYLIFRHLLPNTLGVILVSVTFAIPSAIFTEAFLSFIGMGVVPPTPSWGSMCLDGINPFLSTPHEFLFPAIVISITVLAFNLLGDGLRDALDPRMRSLQ